MGTSTDRRSATTTRDRRASPARTRHRAGDNYLFYTDQRDHPDPLFRWRGKYWSFLLKLSPDRPSPTIQAQPGPYVGPFHWENRRLRVGEIKRLFTYPDNFEFVGSRASVQAQAGNSVPPLLAEKVVGAFRNSD